MKFFYQTMLVLSSVFLFSCHQISDRKLRCYENPLKTTDSTELYIADTFIYKVHDFHVWALLSAQTGRYGHVE